MKPLFIGREKELAVLNRFWAQRDNSIVILYGREGVGKTSLVKQFTEDKSFVYYQARELSETEQNRYFIKKKEELVRAAGTGKVCFVVDEFDLMHKGYKNFYDDLALFLGKLKNLRVMTLLVSSSIQWVENSMVKDVGILAGGISTFIKLKEFSFMEMVDRFPDCTTGECVVIYSVLGGVPAYLNYWRPRESLKKNITRIMLEDDGPLHREAQRFLKTSLRELPYYSTILSVLAEDEPKLNYLYNRTGFSRAKISVYIKNLIQLDVATKIFSYEPEKKDAIQKGLYGITDSFLHFWYKLIYPNLSDLNIMEPGDFYNEHIQGKIDDVIKKTYIKMCREFMELMNRYDKLPVKFGHFGSLYGKKGFIPLIAKSENGDVLAGSCKWEHSPMGMPDFEKFLESTTQIGRDVDHYYLFSKEGFTTELAAMSKNMDNIECIDLEKM